MSNFFLQLAAEGVTVLMYVVTMVVAVFAGIGIRQWLSKKKTA